ncbi:MAG: hypothetical protein EBU36_08645, partial [Verrucomicrobia bacterium]|nr:hypothetical protein [Verrucomicrobiota bacterium]
ANKDHRRWYWEFIAYKGWGKCPVRFICTEEHGDNLPSMIRTIFQATRCRAVWIQLEGKAQIVDA